MESAFDPKKNESNLRKHGVSLAEGDGVLHDPLAVTVEDLSAAGEQRFVTVGRNVWGEVRIVVFTYRNKGARIISVRKPSPKEVRDYEEGI